jgi:poly-gamma-glutamate synthesis protein (capsule biosynthesis protein)
VVHAGDYVALAERKNGPLPRPLDYDYIWGDALELLEQHSPDLRIINLETAVTTSDAYWKGKGINYRMHPGNIRCLTAARIDCCVLANNHVLDWGYSGLTDTLDALHASGMQTAGAGADLKEAQRPAILEVAGKGRVLVFAFGHGSSGIPPEWAATNRRAGVARLEHLTEEAVQQIATLVNEVRLSGDIVVASIHWGGNWGYAVPRERQLFAHHLIDEAGIDVVHGHSSHHPMGIEIYRGKPILYGCGDLLNDYEGITGYEEYRGELSLLYLPSLDPALGTLLHFDLMPMAIRRFRLNRPSPEEIQWLYEMLNREGEKFGTQVQISEGGRLRLSW